MAELFAYTDGACSGNPGPGGWGVLMQAKDGQTVLKQRDLKGGEAVTTNNRMELLAAINALEALERPSEITIFTDSTYVKNGITQWMHSWKRNGWKTAAKKPVKNVGLWQQLDEAQARHSVIWKWVKGHAGHPENEAADALARAASDTTHVGERPGCARHNLPHKPSGLFVHTGESFHDSGGTRPEGVTFAQSVPPLHDAPSHGLSLGRRPERASLT